MKAAGQEDKHWISLSGESNSINKTETGSQKQNKLTVTAEEEREGVASRGDCGQQHCDKCAW